ncbi:MAG: GHKL domain-containing protein [Melioribacter sp.]|nr:GHKL domain-containing protein [Melioribacter sp.]
MLKTTSYKLIYELFDHVLIFDRNNEVVFEGNAFKRLLNSTAKNINSLLSESLQANYNSKTLIETIEQVKSDLEPHTIKLNGIKEEYILFPLNFDLDPHILLTPKDKVVEITRIEHDLKERVKELRCLYNVSKELEASQSINEALEKCIKHVRAAFQFPNDVIINFEIGKKIFGDTSWDPKTINSIYFSDINVNNKKHGEIKVLLKSNVGFLEEEQSMINEISGKFARAIEESEKTINLEKQKKILLAKNETLLRLTEECHQKQEKLRTFFSAISDRIVVIDREFNIIMSNKDDIGDSGKCYNKLFGINERCADCPSLDTFKSAENCSVEKDEGDIYYTLRSYPIFDQDNKVDRVLEVCRDITVQKRMEAQLLQSYKLASLGKLVAGVAHEINNPNTFILGNLKIIQEALDDIFPVLDKHYSTKKDLKIARLDYDVFKDNISTLITDMINGANRTKKIVGDLRNFAKKDDGTLTDNIDLNYIIKNNLTLTRKHVKKYAELEMILAENLPVFKGNINKIEQVILNLVMNASEAIEKSDGLIVIKTAYDENKKEVLLTIMDNGCGMNETTIKNIFDPFFTTKRNKGGTGLGLSITYGIIKDHNGYINVESKLGVGTTFTIHFPIKTCAGKDE